MTVFPGALHAFDGLWPPHQYARHYMGRDPAAAAAALALTRSFLAERLGR